MDDQQLATREFWVDIDHTELGTVIRYPGAFFRTTEEECMPRLRRRAPRLGEHNSEIYVGELGISQEEFASLQRNGVI
jgi:formyl-CoA transferase